MKNNTLVKSRWNLTGIVLAFVLIIPGLGLAQQSKTDTAHKITPVGTSAIVGNIDGVDIEVAVEGPSTENTPLQIACVFEYTEADIFNSPPALSAAVNGMVHLDHDLNGIITELRKSGKFSGHAFETLLITPPPGTIAAKQLLLIGLGDRNKFVPDLMISVAQVAMREALRLNVNGYAFASDLKDAGIDSPTAIVSGDAVKGAFEAYRTETYLKSKNMSVSRPLKKITILAGPSFYAVSSKGIREAISEFKNQQ